MATNSPDTFDRLLAAMPQIAEAVNRFDSPENQRAALAALVHAIDGDASAPENPEPHPAGMPTPPSSIAVTISGGSVGSPTIDAEAPHFDPAALPSLPEPTATAATKKTPPKAAASKRPSTAH